MSQGGKANKTGALLEHLTAEIFKFYGVPIVPHSESGQSGLFGHRFLETRAPYVNIYGREGVSEFLFCDYAQSLKIRIECKAQVSTGSADAKLRELIGNARECFPESVIWIIILGHGWRAGVIEKLKKDAACDVKKQIRVLSLDDLVGEVKNLTESSDVYPDFALPLFSPS